MKPTLRLFKYYGGWVWFGFFRGYVIYLGTASTPLVQILQALETSILIWNWRLEKGLGADESSHLRASQ